MERLFTFGCSFTNYNYPTWADILGLEYDVYDNWGRIGAGNHFIMYSLSECIARNKISKDDTVFIMWTTIAREDRFIKGEWVTEGSVYNSSYTKEMITNYTDPEGYLLTNMSIIYATEQILKGIGCKYTFMNIVPFFEVDDSHKMLKFDVSAMENRVASVFGSTIETIENSVFENIYNNEWPSRDDTHPTPMEHYQYLKSIGIGLSQQQLDYAFEWDNIVASGDFTFNSNHIPNRF